MNCSLESSVPDIHHKTVIKGYVLHTQRSEVGDNRSKIHESITVGNASVNVRACYAVPTLTIAMFSLRHAAKLEGLLVPEYRHFQMRLQITAVLSPPRNVCNKEWGSDSALRLEINVHKLEIFKVRKIHVQTDIFHIF